MPWWRRDRRPVSAPWTTPQRPPRWPIEAAVATQAQKLNVALEVVSREGAAPPVMAAMLCRRMPGLEPAQADALLTTARDAQRLAGAYLWDRSPAAGDRATFAPKPDMVAAVLAAHPWVDEENLGRLYNDACYAVWHG